MILTKNTYRLQASSSRSQSESPAAVPLAGRDGSANLTSDDSRFTLSFKKDSYSKMSINNINHFG
jgi:hypothetical protein